MDLSICIVNWNVKDDLERCLDSVAGAVDLRLRPPPIEGVSSEVILVDNGSSDGSVEMVRERFPEVEVIANDANVGFAAANVQAMEKARGRYILLLNPDTLCPPGSLRELVEFADAHPRAGVIGPKLVYGDGRLQHSCRTFPTITAALFRNTWLGALMPWARASHCYLMEDWDHNEVREVDWVSGACLLVRREAFEQIGPLDVGFYWGSEDVDYCWRAHKAGWQVLYTPKPVITHFVGRSTNQAQVRTIVRTHRSMYRLYGKHVARNCLSRGSVWLGVWARAGLLLTQYAAGVICARMKSLAGRVLRRGREGAS